MKVAAINGRHDKEEVGYLMVIRAHPTSIPRCVSVRTNTHKVRERKRGVYLDKIHVQGGMGKIFRKVISGG